MGVSESGTMGFSTEETYMDYFIISGGTPASILQKYTRDLTGTAPSLPVWTYGIWFSRNSYHSWEVVDSIVKKAEDLRIPLDVVHLDTAWFQEDWSSDLIFGDRLPEPESHMASLRDAGVRISLWQYNFVPPKVDNKSYVEGHEGDYFGKMVNPDGSRGEEVFRYPPNTTGWKKDDCVIDFSNPAARDWYSRKIENLITQGAAAIKTDFGDCIPSAAHYMNIAGRRFQNLYSLVYNMTIWNAIQSKDRDTIVWARSGTAGSQRYPVHWGGDSQCSWSGLQGSLRATLSIGLSGFPYFSHDMGGFIGKPTAELYVRWMQVSMFSSHVRSHGAGNENAREPWHFGDQAVEIYKKFAYLRYQLLPYIVEQAKAGAKLGLPLCRALILEYPQDRNVWGIETEFLFGNDLLIAPTLTPLEESDCQVVYIPSGTWYCFWTKKKLVSRGEWIELAAAPLDHLHIRVKSGAMICFSKERYHTYNTVGDLERVEIYGPAECQSKSCENGQGETIEVVKGSNGTWSCLGRNTVAVEVFE